MKLLTKEIIKALPTIEKLEDPITNQTQVPLKLFNPTGIGTWYVMAKTGDTMFALCDLGSPELGYVSLQELQEFKGPWGLGIERDRLWKIDSTFADVKSKIPKDITNDFGFIKDKEDDDANS